eukprot:6467987-Amphidinium_carterae.2
MKTPITQQVKRDKEARRSRGLVFVEQERLASFVNNASDTDLAHRVKEGDLEVSCIDQYA